MFQVMGTRKEREWQHSRKLAMADTERIWGWSTPAGRVRAERRGALISRRAALQPAMQVLEIGCGTGLFTEIFARSGAVITAVDISEELIAKAMTRGLPRDRVSFMAVPFEDAFINREFDAVVGSSVLHHLQPDEALCRIFRLLKAGGIMVFAEPNMLNPQTILQKNLPFLKAMMGESPDETAFLPWKVRRLLEETGFVEVEVLPFDWLHPLTPRYLITMIANLGVCCERVPFLRYFAGSLLISARRPQDVVS